ncbi:MAG: lysine--tRNA ligase [Actinomycetota bacterium]
MSEDAQVHPEDRSHEQSGDPQERGREAEVLRGRRDSLERIRERGAEPFALSLRSALGVEEPDLAQQVRDRFGDLGVDEITDERRTLAGRVVLLRDIGKLRFLVVRDRSADLQIVAVRRDLSDDDWAALDEVDLGDVLGVQGRVGTTRKGELSLFADRLALLTKALRPLPEKWHGLKDPDLQQRRRYLQLATDPDARRLVRSRAGVLREIRSYLDGRGFVEVETPVIQSVAGGALARPFTTHHHVLDMDLKLRISLELYLKRLLVGGLDRVYEMGRIFRNEGIDRAHNPEFTMLEAYQAYGDYDDMMRLAQDVVRRSARAVNAEMGRDPDSLVVPYRGRQIDLAPDFARITVLDSVSEAVGERVSLDRDDLPELARRHGIEPQPGWGPGKIVQELFEKLVESALWEPTFVCDFPQEVSPLARPHRDDPDLTEHFDLVVGGLELATAFSELTDPDDQRARFEAQQTARTAGDEEAHPLDEDFLRALEHGMPPAGGIGIGIDRLLILLTDSDSARDLILFPHHRPES